MVQYAFKSHFNLFLYMFITHACVKKNIIINRKVAEQADFYNSSTSWVNRFTENFLFPMRISFFVDCTIII